MKSSRVPLGLFFLKLKIRVLKKYRIKKKLLVPIRGIPFCSKISSLVCSHTVYESYGMTQTLKMRLK